MVGSVVGEIVGRVERYVEIGRRAGVVAIDGTLAVLLEDGNLGLGDSKQQQPFQRKPTITCDV